MSRKTKETATAITPGPPPGLSDEDRLTYYESLTTEQLDALADHDWFDWSELLEDSQVSRYDELRESGKQLGFNNLSLEEWNEYIALRDQIGHLSDEDDENDQTWSNLLGKDTPPTKSSTTSSTTTSYYKCRHDATPAYKLDGITYMGGSQSRVEDEFFSEDTLVVCLLGHPLKRQQPVVVVEDEQKWGDLKRVVQVPHQYMTIHWRDYGAPPVDPEFWPALHAAAKRNGMKQVLFYCIGGHGRTGTALAAMLIAIANQEPGEAARYVRNAYCKETIESQSQVDYLNEMKPETKDKATRNQTHSTTSNQKKLFNN